MVCDGLYCEQCFVYIDCKQCIIVLVGDFGDWGQIEQCGIIDKDVDVVYQMYCFGYVCVDVVLFCYVYDDGMGVDLGCGCVYGFFVDIGNCYCCVFGDVVFGEGVFDVVCSFCDDCCFVLQFYMVSFLLLK